MMQNTELQPKCSTSTPTISVPIAMPQTDTPAHTPGQLITTRALMGVGGAFIYPSTLSVLTNLFTEPAERARAIGIWAGVSGIGIAIGPLLGGLLVEHFGWSSVFFINVPICAVALVGAWILVPRGMRHRSSPLDPLGGVLSIVALSSLLFAIIEAPERGWTSGTVFAGFVAAVVGVGAFIAWERWTPAPMLDVRFFKNPRFSAASATITLTQFSLYGSTFLLTLYFQFVLGYSPLKAGLMLMPVAVGLMVGAPIAPRIVTRHGTKRVVVFGLTVVAVCVALYSSDMLMSSVPIGMAIRFFYGFGLGMTHAPVTESIMGSLPPSRAGVGSAVNDTTRQTGGALGVAVLGSVFASHYHQVVKAVAGLSPVQAAQVHDSIGSAQEVAKTLPTGQAQAVRDTAHHAFLSSGRVTFVLASVVVVCAIAVAARWLPAQAAGAEELPADEADLARAEAAIAPA
jgi:EmrB/QacA subfamily drug resistance transporter